jgi:hypothetical protein
MFPPTQRTTVVEIANITLVTDASIRLKDPLKSHRTLVKHSLKIIVRHNTCYYMGAYSSLFQVDHV